MTRPQYDPETQFWLDLRSILFQLIALLEKTKLREVIGMPTTAVRKRMRNEGLEPEESDRD